MGKKPKKINIYFIGYTVLKKRSDWCNHKHANTSFRPYFARFAAARDMQMKWRCYCACALVDSKFAYDMEKLDRRYHTEHDHLVKIRGKNETDLS